MRYPLLAIALIVLPAYGSQYTRDGGTADWMCCADRACATVISQHADAVRARDACGALTDTDGQTRYTRSNPFRITGSVVTPPQLGSVTLSWTPPTRNTDGTVLTDLSGYRIEYGRSATALTQSVQVSNPAATGYVIEGLSPGEWYFAVRTLSGGRESELSNTASKTIL